MKNLLLLALAALAGVCQAATLYVSTDHTGAQTQVDVNHTSSWLLTPTVAFDLGGGRFVMKSGQSTGSVVPDNTIVLSLYQGTDASGTLLASISLTNAQFCAQPNMVANCQNFDVVNFDFSSPIALTAGQNYFVALTSIVPDTQVDAYFIKSANNLFISDGNGDPVDPGSATPEPSSAILTGSCLLAAVLLITRQRRLQLARVRG